MRFLIALATVIATASAAEIPAGTHVLLRLEHPISLRTANVGDGVHFRTASPVSVGGMIVIPVGAWVSGTIHDVKRRGRLGGRAELEIGIDRLLLPTGTAVSISPPVDSTIQTSRSQGSGGRPSLVVGGGMLAGYAGAGIAAVWSHDEETAAGVGLGLALATAVSIAILSQNRDMELRQGATVDIVFDHAIQLN